MRSPFTLWVLLYLCTGNNAYGQRFNVRAYSFTEGLSTYNIKKVVQDHYGFIWIATQDGVYRFDGKSFEPFKKSSESTNSLRENFIFDITLDDQEDLYVSAFRGGVDVINTRTLKVTHLLSEANEKEDGLPNLWINKTFFDQHKQLWVGGEDFLLVYNTITKKTRHFS